MTFLAHGVRRLSVVVVLALTPSLLATPANKAALERDFDRFLGKGLDRCTTCHLPSENKAPESLEEFPHNPFGQRLREVGIELAKAGARNNIPARLRAIAREDADGDGADNETELLIGRNPGDARDTPTKAELSGARKIRGEFAAFLAAYRWKPFEPVQRPAVPKTADATWRHNPIDAFVAAERSARKLTARPEATKEVLLRRVYLDLIGLSPTPEEQRAFAADTSRDAYEKVVDRLLDDPRYGERWGRHWMDIWRYSDWAGWSGGNQIRDSQPHIWRWRDWIVESLNQDKGYDRMILEMLAADELAPEDTNALRATGYLVRNYKMLSREQWMEDTIKHTAQAFLGLTMGCAKCHDHRADPVTQAEYYQLRAIFDPHQVRTDKVPGQLDTAKDGLVRVFDTATNTLTYLLIRGDERRPDTHRVMSPGVPAVLGGRLRIEPVNLPRAAAFPDKRPFVINDTIARSAKAIAEARESVEKLQHDSTASPDKLKEQELTAAVAEAKHAALLATLKAEQLEDENRKDSGEWTAAATEAASGQRRAAVLEARLKLHVAQIAEKEAALKTNDLAKTAATVSAGNPKGAEKALKELEAARMKTTEAEKALADAEKNLEVVNTAYKPRAMDTYPASSTGRRLAFARWLAEREN